MRFLFSSPSLLFLNHTGFSREPWKLFTIRAKRSTPMKYRLAFLLLSLLVSLSYSQTQTNSESALPRLVRFGGTVKDLNGNPLAGVVGVTFALYSEQTGGAALWLETQNVTTDGNGHYVALLGSTKPDGLPADLFTRSRRTGWECKSQDRRSSRACCWSAHRMP